PGVDDLRVHGADVVNIDAKLLPMSWEEAGEEHVGAARELEKHLPALGHRHVQPDAALAAVGVLDIRIGFALDAERAGLPQTALRVTGHGARRGNESVHRDLEDADALEGSHWDAPETTSAKVFDSRNSSNPALPISLPMPDCL